MAINIRRMMRNARDGAVTSLQAPLDYIRSPVTLDEVVEGVQDFAEPNRDVTPDLPEFREHPFESGIELARNILADGGEVISLAGDTVRGSYSLLEGIVRGGAALYEGVRDQHYLQAVHDSLSEVLLGVGGALTASVKIGVGAGHTAYSVARHLLDPIKPHLDKYLDPAAFMAASLLGLSAGFHYANEAFSQTGFGAALLEHPFWDAALKSLIMVPAYVLAIRGVPRGTLASRTVAGKGLWHAAKNISRRTTPSFGNYLKTAGIAAALTAVIAFGGIKDDAMRTWKEFGHVNGPKTLWSAIHNAGSTVYEYMLGKAPAMALEQVVQSFGFETRPEDKSVADSVARHVETVTEAAETPTPISTTANAEDPLVQATKRINANGYNLTPEQVVYLARVGYYEGAWDPKAKTNGRWDLGKMRKGLDGIFSVMRNRGDYDEYWTGRGKKPLFTNERSLEADVGPFGAAFKSGFNKRGVRVWQFTCVRDHLRQGVWYKNDGSEPGIPKKPALMMVQDGKYRVAIGQMDQRIAQLALESLTDVLSGSIPDPTDGATHYKNPRWSDRNNTDAHWRQRGLEKIGVTINSHDFWRIRRDTGVWREQAALELPGESYQEGHAAPEIAAGSPAPSWVRERQAGYTPRVNKVALGRRATGYRARA